MLREKQEHHERPEGKPPNGTRDEGGWERLSTPGREGFSDRKNAPCVMWLTESL